MSMLRKKRFRYIAIKSCLTNVWHSVKYIQFSLVGFSYTTQHGLLLFFTSAFFLTISTNTSILIYVCTDWYGQTCLKCLSCLLREIKWDEHWTDLNTYSFITSHIKLAFLEKHFISFHLLSLWIISLLKFEPGRFFGNTILKDSLEMHFCLEIRSSEEPLPQKRCPF